MAEEPSYTYGGKNEAVGDPADDYVPVTPSATPLADGTCRAILCSEDGFLNLTNRGPERENIPVVKGFNPLRARVIDEPTAGAAPAVVVALY